MFGNQSEFADWLGVSQPYVSQLDSAGRLVLTDDGKIDFERSKDLIEQTGDVTKLNNGRNAKRGEDVAPPSQVEVAQRFNFYKTKKEGHLAHQAELKSLQMQGELLNREAMVRAIYTGFRAIRDNFKAMGATVAPKCKDKSIKEIQAIIDDAVYQTFSAFEEQTIENLAKKGDDD